MKSIDLYMKGRSGRPGRSLRLTGGVRAFRSLGVLVATTLWGAASAPDLRAVSVGERSGDDSVEAQLEAFRVHEDFEVSLFADESLGIANPVAMHWDAEGRLWVLTTLTYAQLEPGEVPNDTLVVLEDTDGDGRADRSTVFADGLNMPMGFALGHGGVFLGEEADLVFLEDTTGDGKADRREVLLTGFGHGDTHQNISNFTWGPDGWLYFSQGLHAYSLVETPWGIVRGDMAGFFRFNPETLQLQPFCFPSLASQNPCGLVFDPSGALFVKSNNLELIYATPGLIPTTRQRNLVPVAQVGSTPGKSMGGEYVASAHLPDWLQHHVLIAGYYANRVSALPLVEEGAGYAKVEPVELLWSSHTSFRPVEVRIGPDGAIYVADWYNPIIGHYQASLRHPDRDSSHGRIWRLSAKDRPLLEREEWSRPETIPVRDYLTIPRDEIATAVEDPSPRRRLDAVVAAANLAEAEALPLALKALDHPRDRFIDYALAQTVDALAPHWLPALEGGELEFANPAHLAYALETLGGGRALALARDRLGEPGLAEDVRESLARVVALEGDGDDLLALLRSEALGTPVLRALAEGASRRSLRPSEGFAEELRRILGSADPEWRVLALRLASQWRARSLAPEVRALIEDASAPLEVRRAAVAAFASLEGEASVEGLVALADGLGSQGEALLQAVAEALVPIAPAQAADIAVSVFAESGDRETVSRFLAPFLNYREALPALAARVREPGLPKEAAGRLVEAMNRVGRQDEELLGVLHDLLGVDAGVRAYSPDFVATLVAEVGESGDAAVGAEVYQRAALACVACHQIEGAGGIVGPPLDAVGAGLTVDLLVESVLWPQRQLKEGYLAVAVTTKAGETVAGYREKLEGGVLHLRDTATGEVRLIPQAEVARIDNVGSLMPEGLTATLSREDLRDLIAYLATLRG